MSESLEMSKLLMQILFGVKQRMKSYKIAKKVEVPEVHGKVLLTIFRMGTIGPTELSTYLSIDKAQLARVISAIEESKLIKKIKCNQDKRSYFLELTKKGREKAKVISEYHLEAVSCLLDGFSEIEREQAQYLLDKMLINLNSNEDVAK